MKRLVKLSVLFAVFALILPVVAAYAEPPLTATPRAVLSRIRDVNGNRLLGADPTTLIYAGADQSPVLAPDGHHLTLGEWISLSGLAEVKCIKKGTHVHIELSGLQPNALYSVWVGSTTFLGALPSVTPEDGVFVTDSAGNGTVNSIVPAGPLSVVGEVSNCLLDYPLFNFSIIYHSDGQLYGPVPGPLNVSLDHVVFIFAQ